MNRLTQERFDRIISDTVSKKHIRGCVFRLESGDGKRILQSAAGNLQTDSIYFVASINKMVLSFITLRLHFEGKLDLDSRIESFFPSGTLSNLISIKNQDQTPILTIRHLLTQTSGLPCYLIDKNADGSKSMNRLLAGLNDEWPFEKMLLEIKKMQPAFAPDHGTKAHYAETNFRLLGAILEKVTNKKLADLLTSLFAELGMLQTFVLNKSNAEIPAAIRHKDQPLNLSNYWHSTNHDIASTAADQILFLRAFFQGDFLPEKDLSPLLLWRRIFFPLQYGPGLQRFKIPRIMSPFKAFPTFIGHSGSVGSMAFYVPEKKMYISGTVNQPANVRAAFQAMVKMIQLV